MLWIDWILPFLHVWKTFLTHYLFIALAMSVCKYSQPGNCLLPCKVLDSCLVMLNRSMETLCWKFLHQGWNTTSTSWAVVCAMWCFFHCHFQCSVFGDYYLHCSSSNSPSSPPSGTLFEFPQWLRAETPIYKSITGYISKSKYTNLYTFGLAY